MDVLDDRVGGRRAAAAGRRALISPVELVLVVSSSEQEDPFPARLGIALAHEPQPLPGWDWSQVKAPPLVDWLSIAGEELALAIDAGSTFAIQDTLTLGPGGSTWTRSRLSHSGLLPANPHLRGAGFGPFGARVGSPGNVTYADWHLAADTEEHECGFYWLLPVTRAEHARADTDGTWNMFADLAASSHELGGDDFALSYDLLR